MLRSADTLEAVCGERAVGIRTPSWDFGPGTLATIREMGLAYDSSLMADEDCYELLLDGEATGVAELPVEWIRDDAALLRRCTASPRLRPHTRTPADVLEIFRRELDAACEAEAACSSSRIHPHIIGGALAHLDPRRAAAPCRRTRRLVRDPPRYRRSCAHGCRCRWRRNRKK